MIRLFLAACAVAALAACAPPAAKTDDAAALREAEEIDAASHDGPTGWLEADGAGETALTWRDGPNAIGFTLSCRQSDKTLTASAESIETSDAPLKPDTAATLLIGAKPFEGKVSPDEGLLTMSMRLPVTPALIAAFADAPSARIVVGDRFMEAGPEGAAKMKAFGDTCAMLTGVKP